MMIFLRLLKRYPMSLLILLAIVSGCVLLSLDLSHKIMSTRQLLQQHSHLEKPIGKLSRQTSYNSRRHNAKEAQEHNPHAQTLADIEYSQGPEKSFLLTVTGNENKKRNQTPFGISNVLRILSSHDLKSANSFSLPSSLRKVIFKGLHDTDGTNDLDLSITWSNDTLNTTLLEDVFRLGFGLDPYVTEDGQQGWIENGVVYSPSRKLDKFKGRKKDVNQMEFEVSVPFNGHLFYEERITDKQKPIKNSDRKIILWHTKARYVPTMKKPQPLRKCPNFPCYITTNRKYSKNSAAMVFAGQIIRGKPPKRTSPEQIFIFHNQEPPLAKWFHKPVFKTRTWKDVFNWTMSYRMDSDVISHYGILRKRPKPIKRNYKSILSKKRHLVAWMVSHCDSPGGREDYVTELKKYVPVDVYGECGPLKCNRSLDDKCAEMIASKYKFYLSFENAICPDYITEKFYRYMSLDIITIARGSNQFSQHAPSEIFLNTANFSTPMELAKIILFLDKHDDRYMEMLREKDKYMQLYEDYPIRNNMGVVQFVHYHYEAVPFCEVCQKLWNLDKYSKTISNIGEWFDRKLCQKPLDLVF